MKVAILEKTLGYEFKDRKLIERALTHRSRAHEQFPGGSEAEIRALDNETLEFVGDSVLGLAIAEELFTRNPDMTEGELTLMKHRLVSMETLAVVADTLEIGRNMRIGRGEERTGGRVERHTLEQRRHRPVEGVGLLNVDRITRPQGMQHPQALGVAAEQFRMGACGLHQQVVGQRPDEPVIP